MNTGVSRVAIISLRYHASRFIEADYEDYDTN